MSGRSIAETHKCVWNTAGGKDARRVTVAQVLSL